MMTLLDRFMDKVSPEPNSGCWLWTGACHGDGYGHIGIATSKPDRAHRVAYRLFRGEIPSGMQVRHKCDVPSCVNPDHLVVGTHQDNMGDRDTRLRTAKGRQNGKTTLTEEQVRFAKTSPLSRRKVAALLGCHNSTIDAIRSGKSWAWLEV